MSSKRGRGLRGVLVVAAFAGGVVVIRASGSDAVEGIAEAQTPKAKASASSSAKPAAPSSGGVKDGRKPGSGSCNNSDNKCSGDSETCRDNLCYCKGVEMTNTGDKLDWRRCEASGLEDRSCIDIMNAHDHCGACNKPCGKNAECDQGKCKACGAGKTQCYGFCVSLAEDESNCGKCGHRCPDDFSCVRGTCQP